MIQSARTKRRPARNQRLEGVLIGGLIGAVIFILQFGTDVLKFTEDAWLLHSQDLEGITDLTQHYLGWCFYRQSAWHFPIGLFDGLSPEPMSVVYTDSIPLFAVIFKILSPLLPKTFQYFGLFQILSYILMGVFGALIGMKVLGEKTTNSAAAILFILTPVLLKRAFYHTALSAHFLILAAICIFLYKEDLNLHDEKKKRKLNTVKKCWIALISLSFLINAYYVPMVFGIMVISYAREILWLHYKKRSAAFEWKELGLVSLFSTLLCVIFGVLLGMFSGHVTQFAENIEDVSFNLNQFFNPSDPYLIHGANDPNLYYFNESHDTSSIFQELSLYTPWQHEGYAYLGFGIILLLLVAATIMFINVFRIEKRNLRTYRQKSTLITVCVGGIIFLLFSLGPRATLGTFELYHIKWPEAIYNLLSIFRTAGRLIWPVYYGIITFLLAVIGETLKNRGSMTLKTARLRQGLLLAIILSLSALQLIDLYPMIKRKHEIYDTVAEVEAADPYINKLDRNEEIKALGEEKKEIIFVYPTYAIKFRPYWSTVFEGFAYEHGLKMNAAYSSRDTTALSDAYANENMNNKDVIYVFIYQDLMNRYKDMPVEVIPYEGVYIGYLK